jgi:hypothetical protein
MSTWPASTTNSVANAQVCGTRTTVVSFVPFAPDTLTISDERGVAGTPTVESEAEKFGAALTSTPVHE